jgi:hypothetical protein
MNFKLSVLSSLAVLSTLTFGSLMVPQQALAGCGWLDITCKNSGLRQLGRNLDPTNTTVTEIFIVNETPNTVSYMLNNYENQLKPGDVLRLHAQRRDGFHISLIVALVMAIRREVIAYLKSKSTFSVQCKMELIYFKTLLLDFVINSPDFFSRDLVRR